MELRSERARRGIEKIFARMRTRLRKFLTLEKTHRSFTLLGTFSLSVDWYEVCEEN
jgi:hypothetical protein